MWLKKYQWNIFKAVLVSATSSVLSGYDQGVIAAAMITMQPDLGLSMTEEEVSIGVLNVAAAFGGLLAGQLADRFGRRLSLALANILFFVGSLMLAVCEGFNILALGRVIMGLGVGVGKRCSRDISRNPRFLLLFTTVLCCQRQHWSWRPCTRPSLCLRNAAEAL
jgi:MFS family permease